MSYFVTGATGFIGRHLVECLLANREGDIHVLVREGSADNGRVSAKPTPPQSIAQHDHALSVRHIVLGAKAAADG